MSDLENASGEGRQTGQAGSRRSGKAYEGAFEAVASILIAGGLGYWADATWDTSPRYLLVGFAIGFGAFVLRLYRLGGAMQTLEAEEAATVESAPEKDD